MNGLLLPHRDLDLSANAPISGAIMIPDNGLFRADDQYSIHVQVTLIPRGLIECVLKVCIPSDPD